MRISISSFAAWDERALHTSKLIPLKQMPRQWSGTCWPLRVIALNVDEGWSQDVSEAMAHKVREIAEHEDYELTQGTLDFIDVGRVRQPTLPALVSHPG